MRSQCKNYFAGSIRKILVLMAVLPILPGFRAADVSLPWLEQRLQRYFNPGADVKLKKFELHVTDEGFFRLRKFFPNGKQEYFSFNLRRLKDISYLGDTISGTLLLTTAGADIIVQTYNDRKGNIDSMAGALPLPLKNIETTQLDSISEMLLKVKN
ncbi:hypothetical protein [Hufsiella ginkgonis]|uniref:Uncharacterized protein n=1 Tax=Hufsiella ginkgonis TaxID=2695274 RepID=A0A7K1XV63_9SPHI|nr:hypothetical protein [Hufsiella ginkgonis]MXV14659.1 hypothetical protein [Hufsiella ginkgonis]